MRSSADAGPDARLSGPRIAELRNMETEPHAQQDRAVGVTRLNLDIDCSLHNRPVMIGIALGATIFGLVIARGILGAHTAGQRVWRLLLAVALSGLVS